MAIAFQNAPAATAPATDRSTSPPDRLGALLSAVTDVIRRSQAQNQLARLDDRTLKDIGVHRTEISSILHHDRRDPSRRSR